MKYIKLKASFWVLAFMVYLALAIIGFETAKAETSTSDKMMIVTDCIVLPEMVASGLPNNPEIAQVFREVSEWYVKHWEREFPTTPYRPFAARMWDYYREQITKGELKWEAMVQFAGKCGQAMEDAQ